MRYITATFLFCVFSVPSLAAQTDTLHTFTPGSAIKASEVNDNFQAVANAIHSGILGWELIRQTFIVPVTSNQPGSQAPTYTSDCSTGKRVLGGGFSGQVLSSPGANGGTPMLLVLANQPGGVPGQPDGTRWEVQVYNNTNSAQTIVVTAICAPVE